MKIIELIPITVLTGFLGSGKTSLLNRFLSSTSSSDTAVLINEFGEIGLDHLLVDTINEDIILLESGCVCCNVRDDLCSALLGLISSRQKQEIPSFKRVFLETTGIADPTAIHQLIMSDKDIVECFTYKNTITIIDAVHGEQTLDKHIEAVKQVSIADQLLISKAELCTQSSISTLETRLQKINPVAPIAQINAPEFNVNSLHKQSRRELTESPRFWTAHEPNRVNSNVNDKVFSTYDHRFSTFCLTWEEAVKWEDFVAWLEGLLLARGDSIHRLKGLVNITNKSYPVVVQGVQHSFYPPQTLDQWPDGIPMTKLVFITSDFTRLAAIKSLEDIFNFTIN